MTVLEQRISPPELELSAETLEALASVPLNFSLFKYVPLRVDLAAMVRADLHDALSVGEVEKVFNSVDGAIRAGRDETKHHNRLEARDFIIALAADLTATANREGDYVTRNSILEYFSRSEDEEERQLAEKMRAWSEEDNAASFFQRMMRHVLWLLLYKDY